MIVAIPNRKGWMNFLAIGNWPDAFYKEIQSMHRAFLAADDEYDGFEVVEHLQYRVNTLVLKCLDFDDFEKKMNTARDIPYWHPHANTIVYYENAEESNDIIAKILFILWYYKMCNAILLQYNDDTEKFTVTHYNPYISEHFKLKYSYGCWTTKKITYPIENFEKSFTCTEGCHNVTVRSKLRADHLGTCIGFETIVKSYEDNASSLGSSLFNDKTKDLHGFTLRAYVKDVVPFVRINVNDDGTYTLNGRDGLVWATLSQNMNFSLDFSPSEKIMKGPFDFEESIQQIFEFAQRRGDLLLIPIYQFDLVIVEIDMTTAFKASGVCFMAHRAGFETTLFDVKVLLKNYTLVIKFVFCFLGTWFVFFIFNFVEKGSTSFDQFGKDLINAYRNMLSVSLFKPPKKQTFRMFLFFSIWSFFAINFVTQAAIISFFSAHKRGKDVDTYDDIIEKGYPIEGMASPDVVLPDTEEKFRKINSKLVPIQDIFGCVNHMSNDSRRFCLIDCSVGRYLERNKLNDKGEQYLHITKDQIHNYYTNFIFHRNSPMSDQFNRIMLIYLQAGLVDKWEQYRFTDIKDEALIKALDMSDLGGVFKCYFLLTIISCVFFAIEVAIGLIQRIKQFSTARFLEWKKRRVIKKHLKRTKIGPVKLVNSFTQTT
ncbi:uncharacterized protein LOC114356887 [Ostrinia furnacalis]|uniref:uncharacterized protein LOC114356887 n=1 Tax=Ostrinia furnacalis TaxID=93504 RepID=UPI00103DC34A|nr:uncharacterized protein LOC114356887 [Ostrinia furnacalis]